MIFLKKCFACKGRIFRPWKAGKIVLTYEENDLPKTEIVDICPKCVEVLRADEYLGSGKEFVRKEKQGGEK